MGRKTKEGRHEYYLEHREEELRKKKEWYYSMPKEWMWAKFTIKNHKHRGIEVQVSLEELDNLATHTKICRYCDCALVYMNDGIICPQSASLDRINNENLINLNNIQIICHKCNSTKRDRTHAEFISYCKSIADRFYKEDG